MEIFVGAARGRGEALDHVLIFGPPGLGKTTLAHVIANEMGVAVRQTSGPVIERAGDLAAILTNLRAGDVLFIDEVHRLGRAVEEVLYPAMEDNTVSVEQRGFSDLMKQLGVAHSEKSVTTHRLPPFTLIGATTLQGLVSAPLRSRFRQVLELQPYTPTKLQLIVSGTAVKLGFELPERFRRGRNRGLAE